MPGAPAARYGVGDGVVTGGRHDRAMEEASGVRVAVATVRLERTHDVIVGTMRWSDDLLTGDAEQSTRLVGTAQIEEAFHDFVCRYVTAPDGSGVSE